MTTTSGSETSRANLALAISGVAVLMFLIAVVAGDENDWLWPVAGLLGAAGAAAGWMAGKPKLAGKAMLAVVLGGLVFLFILGWIIWAAATGNF
jgi:hypothetical protein